MDFNWNIFLESWPALLKGCVVTAELSVISILAGTIIGILGGIARLSRVKVVSGLMTIYVTIFRAVPLLVTLLFIYYGMPAAGIQLEAFTVAILALSLTNGAYITEIVRSGVESLDPGQMRAARSLGMPYALAMRRIILPQALRRVLAPITNESITLLKSTSLVSTIALGDVLRAGLDVMAWKANTFSPFAGVALCYLALTLPLLALNDYLEKRYRVT
ncbi:MAG TPA: amino acid ABC transporter permease [Xanthobacteraceae bacterium]|jgi:polar amino acid transport system permease protein